MKTLLNLVRRKSSDKKKQSSKKGAMPPEKFKELINIDV